MLASYWTVFADPMTCFQQLLYYVEYLYCTCIVQYIHSYADLQTMRMISYIWSRSLACRERRGEERRGEGSGGPGSRRAQASRVLYCIVQLHRLEGGSRCRLPSDAGRLIGFMHIHTQKSPIDDLGSRGKCYGGAQHFTFRLNSGGADTIMSLLSR